MAYSTRSVTSSWATTSVVTLLTWLGALAGIGVTTRQIAATDFPVDMAIYREGVRAFMSGGEMYDVPMYAGDLALPFIYPPFGALVLVPLTAPPGLTDVAAAGIMIGLSNLLVLACLWVVLHAIAGELKKPIIRMVAMVVWPAMLLIEPVDLNNGFAQINIVLMALVVFDLVPRKPSWLPQGTLIGIAAAIKLTPLVFGLYWLVRRDWRSILTAAISAIVCTLLAAIWRFDATVQFYFSTLAGMGTTSEFGVDTTYQSNSSLKGMLMRFAPDGEWLDANGTLINVLWLMLALVTVVAGGWLMYQLIQRGLHVDAVLVNAVVMLLISPVSWSHHWVWLALIIPVFAWRSTTIFGYRGFLGGLLVVWSLLIFTVPPKWWFGDAIDLWALDFFQRVLVSDFVWLGGLLLVAVALGIRRVDRPDKGDERELLADGRVASR